MKHGLTARVVVLAFALGLIGTGTAEAAPAPTGNAVFIRPGAAVYAEDAVGVGCRTFGFCDGAAAELAATATPRYLSTRPDERCWSPAGPRTWPECSASSAGARI
jgi:hypothetical protein